MDTRTLDQVIAMVRAAMRDRADGGTSTLRWSDEEYKDAIRTCLEQWQRGVFVPVALPIATADIENGYAELPSWAVRHVIAVQVKQQGRWQNARSWAADGPTGQLLLPAAWTQAGGDARVVAGWANPVEFPSNLDVYRTPDSEYEIQLSAGGYISDGGTEIPDYTLPETGIIEASRTRIWYTGWTYDDLANVYILQVGRQEVKGGPDTAMESTVPGRWLIAVDDPNLWAHMRHSCQAYLHTLPLTMAAPESRDHHERQAMYHQDRAAQIWRERKQLPTSTMRLNEFVF